MYNVYVHSSTAPIFGLMSHIGDGGTASITGHPKPTLGAGCPGHPQALGLGIERFVAEGEPLATGVNCAAWTTVRGYGVQCHYCSQQHQKGHPMRPEVRRHWHANRQNGDPWLTPWLCTPSTPCGELCMRTELVRGANRIAQSQLLRWKVRLSKRCQG